MYRKYSGSNKTSRNERLAQLTEQESVIERKKREILAKIEAQKKKETEDAFKKLEPPNILKKGDFPNSEKHSCKSEEILTKEAKVQFPKNAFSNDGSFLDHFKKLSGTSVDHKSDSSLCSAAPAKKENLYKKQDYFEKGKPDMMSMENNYSQRGSLEFPTKEMSVNTSTDNAGYNKFCYSKFSSNSHSKLITNYLPPHLSSMTKVMNNEETNMTQNTSHSFCKDNDDQVREKFINFKNKWENQGSTYENSVLNANQPQYNITMPLSKTNYLEMDKSARISPALTNCEEDCSQASENYHSSDRVAQHGEETKNSLKRAAIDEINRFSSGKGGDHRSRSPFLNAQTAAAGYSNAVSAQSDRTSSFDEERLHRKDSSDSDTNSRESFQSYKNYQQGKDQKLSNSDGYQADCEEGSSCSKIPRMGQKKLSFHKALTEDSSSSKEEAEEGKDNEKPEGGDVLTPEERRKRRKKSRWGDEVASSNAGLQLPSTVLSLPLASGPTVKTTLLSKLTRSDPGLIQYAKQTFGSTNLSEDDWKKAEDHYKINLLYQDMVKKRAEIDRLEKAGKFKYEYDSDEDVEGGTWEHKLRQQEMMATQLWAEELTRQAAGKHHIGDFLPPEELERFMERYNAVKQGRKPDLSDYKEFKLKEDNVGYRLLQKMGWNEGQGLGQDGSGITNPVNKASTRHENQGLGVVRPDGLEAGDDEYDAYRKRMMLAYRFRPNPLNNPRRPYY